MKWNKFWRRNVSEEDLSLRPYINYKSLKSLVTKDSSAQFECSLTEQLSLVFNSVKMMNEQESTTEQLHHIHQYCYLNVTSTEKIVKKWKKHVGQLSDECQTMVDESLKNLKVIMSQLNSEICVHRIRGASANTPTSTTVKSDRRTHHKINHEEDDWMNDRNKPSHNNETQRGANRWMTCGLLIVMICTMMAAVLYFLTGSSTVVLGSTMTLASLLTPMVYYLTRESTTGGSSNSSTSSKMKEQETESFSSDITHERLLYLLPWNIASYIWGKFHHITLPVWAREPMYMAWTIAFKCNLDEMRYPLKSYRCLGDFFSRPLKDDMRPVHPTIPLVSPVDGTVYSCTRVENGREKLNEPVITHVKGLNYSFRSFLGKRSNLYDDDQQQSTKKKTSLYQCVIYLAPGDYHRIHSSADWTINRRKHFPGALLPVNPVFVKHIKGLFAVNERVVIEGTWNAKTVSDQELDQQQEKYFFSLSAVGAYNVGSIELNFDQQVVTNEKPHRISSFVPKVPENPDADLEQRCPNRTYTHDRIFPSGMNVQRGEEVAKFKLGSTVVLIFEAPDDMDLQFCVKSGQKVRVGQPLISEFSQ